MCVDHLKRRKTSTYCRGTQHITGTVSNEATSDMGYPAWPAGRTCIFHPKFETVDQAVIILLDTPISDFR